MSLKYFLPAAALLVHLVPQTGMAQTAPPLPAPTASSISVQDFQQFQRPQLFHDLYVGDLAALRRDKVETFRYVMPIIQAFSQPDTWYRIGLDADVMLDPQLAPVARGISMTHRGVMEANMKPALEAAKEMFLGFGLARKENMDANRVDPIGEMIALNQGLVKGGSSYALMLADAKHDAKNLMVLSQYDPLAFLEIYDSIREFIYAF